RLNLGQGDAPQLDNGIGRHVGVAGAGLIGSPDRLEFTVIGNVVNMAARLESQARSPHPPILMSAAAAARLNGTLQVVSIGTIPLKGMTEPVALFAPAEAI
ncbi:MAG: adenylate/guanylate cyclase domain-containing protein, partial [Alphaproteobacteria bacterium]|nr:adenylate/guanylate cyclase domain-containing protein [Alphaproteobacteria bacterium]